MKPNSVYGAELNFGPWYPWSPCYPLDPESRCGVGGQLRRRDVVPDQNGQVRQERGGTISQVGQDWGSRISQMRQEWGSTISLVRHVWGSTISQARKE